MDGYFYSCPFLSSIRTSTALRSDFPQLLLEASSSSCPRLCRVRAIVFCTQVLNGPPAAPGEESWEETLEEQPFLS